MKILNKLLFIYFIITVSGCKTENPDKGLSIPYLTNDFVSNKNLFLDTSYIIKKGHIIKYIGKLTDTIQLEYAIFPSHNLPLKDSSGNSSKEFDSFFLKWNSDKEYSYVDSSSKIDIYIDTNSLISHLEYESIPVFIINNDKDTLKIGYGDEIPLTTELLIDGNWKTIRKEFKYDCPVGMNYVILPPNQILIVSTPNYKFHSQKKLRIKLKNHTSNIYYTKSNVN